MSKFDVVIRGGSIVDGTGAPARRADVGIAGGLIVAIDEAKLEGDLELDASGQVVAPGFIDIHTHYDAQVFWDPWLTPSSFHGVTSVIAGNCGFSIAPVQAEVAPLLARTLKHVEDMSFETLTAGVPWDTFETFPDYLNAVDKRRPALNFGCYVGHTAVRLYVMGEDAYERSATDTELKQMQRVVAEAIEGGAIGFASSASPTHNGDNGRPVPSRLSDVDELRTLLMPLREAGRGVVALFPGGAITHEVMFELQEEVRRPFTWTALLTLRGNPYHEKVISEHEAAWDRGIEVWPQVSCRPLVFQINLLEPFSLNPWKSFSSLMGKSFEERADAYRDPSWRETAWAETNMPNGALPPHNWNAIAVAESDSRPDLISRRAVDLSEEWGCTPLDVVLDISLRDELRTRFWSVVANDEPEVVGELLPRDHLLIGLADSGAHISQLCDACFATDLIGPWVRDRRVMSLERAVHKLTGEPAAVYGLSDRGTISVGKAADICVFDPETVAPGPLRRIRDFPADGERLIADAPVGMTHTLVNGITIRANGLPVEEGLAEGPGQLLRS